ncbi:MAG: hypothetical protein PHE93_05855 [Clostridia bacterium]|nr:hypothetical protein [Clostridia bacterium]
MSNIKHQKCKIRHLAGEAKERMKNNSYNACTSAISAQSKLSPAEQTVLTKMLQVMEQGEEIINPIAQLCDKEILNTLSTNDRQRYILELSNAYLCLKQKMMDKLDFA